MSFSQEIKNIRQHCFLSQESFARELNVSFSSVNRWESGRATPNLIGEKDIKESCEAKNINLLNIENEWLEYGREDSNDSK